MDTQNIIQTAHAVADAARRAVLPYFRSGNLDAENKDAAGYDPVTQADRAAEVAMRSVLAEMRPQDGIYGEEFGQVSGASDLVWVLDPVDGTRSFISGVPLWGVLISVTQNGKPLYGIIDQPYTNERFEGGFGRAEVVTAAGTAPLRTRAGRPLSQSILLSTYPELTTPEETAAFQQVAQEVQLCRFGTDCYAYALVAAGQVDLVVEAGLQPYDICAPIAVIEAAGGIVTDWQGGPAHNGGRVIAAANPAQHAAALEILKGCV